MCTRDMTTTRFGVSINLTGDFPRKQKFRLKYTPRGVHAACLRTITRLQRRDPYRGFVMPTRFCEVLHFPRLPTNGSMDGRKVNKTRLVDAAIGLRRKRIVV